MDNNLEHFEILEMWWDKAHNNFKKIMDEARGD
jgi:hypothetical protein